LAEAGGRPVRGAPDDEARGAKSSMWLDGCVGKRCRMLRRDCAVLRHRHDSKTEGMLIDDLAQRSTIEGIDS